ncbi:tudor and KH domain-containing protein [Cricetulus griseus]|nr:tudor and KH domain-containing protein [Cricetulus griseus]
MFEQLSVTQRSVDRIIGRGGKMIRSICKASGSKITCDKGSEGTLLLSRLVNISGTQKEVAAAKQLILEKVSEDEELGKRIAHSAETRVPRKQPISVRREEVMEPGGAGEELYGRILVLAWGQLYPWMFLSTKNSPETSMIKVPSPDFCFHKDEYLDIHISAYEHPNHFWIQIIGSHSLQLDQLIIEMSQHYENSLSEDLTVHVGDIVAAPYSADGSWC